MLAAIRTRPRALLPKTAASAAGWRQQRGATNGAEQDVWPPYRHLVERTPEPKEGEWKVNVWDQANVRKQEMFSYHTPPFYKTRVEDIADKWGDLGFAIRPMNGHVRYTWSDGKWDDGQFVPAPYQLMHINSGALHYGVGVFEGTTRGERGRSVGGSPDPLGLFSRTSVQSSSEHSAILPIHQLSFEPPA